MKMASIREHLGRYSMVSRRVTTINNAFASVIAPYETYDPVRVARAIRDLGQDPERDLKCVYCGKLAETWDHVYGLVKQKEYSGFGHTLGNLVPCCKICNQKKGKKEWTRFLEYRIKDEAKQKKRIAELESYFKKHPSKSISLNEIRRLCPKEMKHLRALQVSTISSMQRADALADQIREKIGSRYRQFKGMKCSSVTHR